jgi:hypothetical protein
MTHRTPTLLAAAIENATWMRVFDPALPADERQEWAAFAFRRANRPHRLRRWSVRLLELWAMADADGADGPTPEGEL